MQRILFLTTALTLSFCPGAAPADFDTPSAAAKPLFDGKTLAGWEGETKKTWRVEDGAIGGLVALSAMVVFGQHLIVYAAAVLVTMMVCWALNMASASRLAGVTATIILLVPHSDSAIAVFLSRVTEVGWGVLVAVSVVWLAARLPARWWLRS